MCHAHALGKAADGSKGTRRGDGSTKRGARADPRTAAELKKPLAHVRRASKLSCPGGQRAHGWLNNRTAGSTANNDDEDAPPEMARGSSTSARGRASIVSMLAKVKR